MITECKQLLNSSADLETRLQHITAFSHLNRREQHIAGQPAQMSFGMELPPVHVISLVVSYDFWTKACSRTFFVCSTDSCR